MEGPPSQEQLVEHVQQDHGNVIKHSQSYEDYFIHAWGNLQGRLVNIRPIHHHNLAGNLVPLENLADINEGLSKPIDPLQ